MWKGKCGEENVERKVWKGKCGEENVERKVWRGKCGEESVKENGKGRKKYLAEVKKIILAGSREPANIVMNVRAGVLLKFSHRTHNYFSVKVAEVRMSSEALPIRMVKSPGSSTHS